MSRRFALAVVILLTTTLSAAGTRAAGDEASHPSRPEMSFTLSAYHGVKPMDLKLTAKIKQSGPRRMKSCWIQTDWKNTTGVGLPFQSRDETPCTAERAEIRVPESFEKTLTLEKAGTYTYRIILEDGEGKRYASATREVKVLESKLGLGVSTTQD